MNGRRLSIRYFAIGLTFLLSIACGSVSSISPATEVPPTSTNTPLPTATDIPTLTPTQTPIPYRIFKELTTFQASSDGVASMVFSPDGKFLAYSDYGNSIITLIDISTGETVKTFEGHPEVTALAFSPDGETLASTGTVKARGSVRLWDIQTGKQLAVFQTAGIRQLGFSPDSALLAGAAGGNPVQIFLWDVKSYSQKKTFKNVSRFLFFSPDGSMIATGGRDNLLHILDVETGSEVMSLSAHSDWVSSAAYSADGKLLASGGWDKSIYLWDTANGNQLKAFTGHEGEISSLAFSPEGTVLASLGNGIQIARSGGQFTRTFVDADKFLRFWDIETSQQIGKIEMANGVSTVAFTTDWAVIATGDDAGLIQVWEAGP